MLGLTRKIRGDDRWVCAFVGRHHRLGRTGHHVDANAPNAPEIVSPRNGEVNVPRRPTLSSLATASNELMLDLRQGILLREPPPGSRIPHAVAGSLRSASIRQ